MVLHDGNGRMSRLLTYYYYIEPDILSVNISVLKKLIEDTKEVYYDSLQKSSIKWHENANDYEPFVKYMLGGDCGGIQRFLVESEMADDRKLIQT